MVPAHCSCCRNRNSTPNHRRQDPLVCAAFAHAPSRGRPLLLNLLAHYILVLFRLVSLTTPPGQTLSNRLFDHPSRPKRGFAASATEAARQRQQFGASGGTTVHVALASGLQTSTWDLCGVVTVVVGVDGRRLAVVPRSRARRAAAANAGGVDDGDDGRDDKRRRPTKTDARHDDRQPGTRASERAREWRVGGRLMD